MNPSKMLQVVYANSEIKQSKISRAYGRMTMEFLKRGSSMGEMWIGSGQTGRSTT